MDGWMDDGMGGFVVEQVKEKACQADLQRGKYRTSGCFSLLDDVLDATGTLGSGKMTMYVVECGGV